MKVCCCWFVHSIGDIGSPLTVWSTRSQLKGTSITNLSYHQEPALSLRPWPDVRACFSQTTNNTGTPCRYTPLISRTSNKCLFTTCEGLYADNINVDLKTWNINEMVHEIQTGQEGLTTPSHRPECVVMAAHITFNELIHLQWAQDKYWFSLCAPKTLAHGIAQQLHMLLSLIQCQFAYSCTVQCACIRSAAVYAASIWCYAIQDALQTGCNAYSTLSRPLQSTRTMCWRSTVIPSSVFS